VGGRVIPLVAEEDGALYRGVVVHKRARPKRHSLRYSVFSMLVDLDQLPELEKRLRFFSVDRWNLFSLRLKDFGPRDGTSLADFARRRADAAGVGDRVDRVRMLAYPRILGYAFNPLTVYYLEDAEGRVLMLLYEVRNTFGEHHFYQHVLPEPNAGQIQHAAPKAFYVSPFNTLEGTYRFSVRAPRDEVFTGIALSTDEGGLVTAYFDGKRDLLSDHNLLRVALAYPFMTVKIIFGIHWEALKLWLKGVPHTLGLRQKPKTGVRADSAR
jgi:uncharacterized protein